MRTDELILRLVRGSAPVRRLAPPGLRVAFWLAASVPYLVLIVFAMSPRIDLPERLSEPRFLLEIAMALTTAIGAAIAAFSTIVPGAPRWRRLLPLPPLAVWLASLGEGCLTASPEAQTLDWDWFCLPAITVSGAVPAILMFWMLRRGAPLYPCATVAFGAMAATALGAFGLRFFHVQDASIMVLVWQFGTVALFTSLASCAGRRILVWRKPIDFAR